MSEWNKDFYQIPVRDIDARLDKALPCPFCGSMHLQISRMSNYIHCIRCGADGPEVSIRMEQRWVIALEKWNMRANYVYQNTALVNELTSAVLELIASKYEVLAVTGIGLRAVISHVLSQNAKSKK